MAVRPKRTRTTKSATVNKAASEAAEAIKTISEVAKEDVAAVKEAAAEKMDEVKEVVAEKIDAAKAAKADIKTDFILQYAGNEVNMTVLNETAKKAFIEEGHKESDIKDITIYLKPEDAAAYYVINGVSAGKIALF